MDWYDLSFDFEGIGEHHYYKVPIIGISYLENMAEIHWQCDFNRTTILDKTDHHGHSSILLLNRKKLSALEHRHENKLIVHGEFPEPAHVLSETSFINFFFVKTFFIGKYEVNLNSLKTFD